MQFNKNKSFYYQSYISDLGDLSTYFGYEEIDATGYQILPGKLYPKTLKNFKKFQKLNIKELHEQGYSSVKIKNLGNEHRNLKLPIHLLSEYEFFNPVFSLGSNPAFFLEKAGKKEYLIINGAVFKL